MRKINSWQKVSHSQAGENQKQKQKNKREKLESRDSIKPEKYH